MRSVSMRPSATHESGHSYFAQTGHSHFAATAIAPCLPDLRTGPKIAPITNAWGGFNEETLLDVSGLRCGDFALRRPADERAGRRRRSVDTAAAIPSGGGLFPLSRQLYRGPREWHRGRPEGQHRHAQSRLSPRDGVHVGG